MKTREMKDTWNTSLLKTVQASQDRRLCYMEYTSAPDPN